MKKKNMKKKDKKMIEYLNIIEQKVNIKKMI